MASFIHSIEYFIPEQKLSNFDISNIFPEWDAEKIGRKIGIESRGVAKDDEFASDLGFQAAEKLFRESSIPKESIDFLLYCTQSPDYFLPTTACILQDKLGLSKNIGALDYNLGCSGYVYGLALAKGLIESKIAKNILLITAETYSKFIHPKDKSNRTIFGDGASATLITNNPHNAFAEILEFDLGTDGSGADNLIVKEGAVKRSNSQTIDSFDEYGNIISPEHLYMNGGEIFHFTSANIPILITATLGKNKLKKTDINLFIFHQANKYMLEHLRKKIGIEESLFFVFMKNVGNTVSSTIPIALKESLSLHPLGRGNHILLAGFGVGYSWGGTILRVV